MLQRQRLSVHADRYECVAAVERRHRKSAGVPVARAANDLIGPGVDSRFSQQIIQTDAEPSGIAGELAPNLIGDAGEGDVGFDQGPGRQLVERQVELPRHHPGDPEGVVLGSVSGESPRLCRFGRSRHWK